MLRKSIWVMVRSIWGIGETCRKVTRPDPTHLGRLASSHGLVADRGVVLAGGNPPRAAGDAGLDTPASALWAQRVADGGLLHAQHPLHLSPRAPSINAQRVGPLLPLSYP